MIYEKAKLYIDKAIAVFDPTLIFIGLALMIYFVTQLMTQFYNAYTIVITSLAALGCALVYLCLVTNFELFSKCRSKNKSLVSRLLCCTLGHKIREKGFQNKLKNAILLTNIVIAIVITVLTQKTVNEELASKELMTVQERDHIKQSLSMVNFIFWIILLYDLVLGCFKLSIILTICVLSSPCIILFVIRNRDNIDSQMMNDGDQDLNNTATRQLVMQKMNKRITDNQLKKLLRSIFFQRKVVYNQSEQKVDNCSICLDQFNLQDEIIKLNCDEGHIFHLPCIEGWALTNNSCPLCRKNLIDEKDIVNNKNQIMDMSQSRDSLLLNRSQSLNNQVVRLANRHMEDQQNLGVESVRSDFNPINSQSRLNHNYQNSTHRNGVSQIDNSKMDLTPNQTEIQRKRNAKRNYSQKLVNQFGSSSLTKNHNQVEQIAEDREEDNETNSNIKLKLQFKTPQLSQNVKKHQSNKIVNNVLNNKQSFPKSSMNVVSTHKQPQAKMSEFNIQHKLREGQNREFDQTTDGGGTGTMKQRQIQMRERQIKGIERKINSSNQIPQNFKDNIGGYPTSSKFKKQFDKNSYLHQQEDDQYSVSLDQSNKNMLDQHSQIDDEEDEFENFDKQSGMILQSFRSNRKHSHKKNQMNSETHAQNVQLNNLSGTNVLDISTKLTPQLDKFKSEKNNVKNKYDSSISFIINQVNIDQNQQQNEDILTYEEERKHRKLPQKKESSQNKLIKPKKKNQSTMSIIDSRAKQLLIDNDYQIKEEDESISLQEQDIEENPQNNKRNNKQKNQFISKQVIN
eukprot:403357454